MNKALNIAIANSLDIMACPYRGDRKEGDGE
jgi:hypothetical protein